MGISKIKQKLTLFVIACCLFGLTSGNAQDKYFTTNGTITFESSVPSFEEVKATNSKVSAVLRSDGSFASLVLIKGFRFKIALMEEHFNESYIESQKFPKSSFSGKIKDFSIDKLTAEYQEFELEGKLTLRKISQSIATKCMVKIEGNTISLSADFKTKPELYGIEIPSIVRKKIAEYVDVSATFELIQK